MKTILLASLLAVACVGCTTTSLRWKDIEIKRKQLGVKTETDTEVTLPDGTHVKVTAKADPSVEALKAVAEGAAAGATRFIKP